MIPPSYYSQHGEDYLLWHFFDYRRDGYFVDIGAHDGISLSNTKSFEDNGWTGICVEPIPIVADACRKIRGHVVQAACVAGMEKSVSLRVDRPGLWAGIQTDEQAVARAYHERGSGEPDFQTIEVPAIRASELVSDQHRAIDFISLDVEGTEIEVLKGLDLRRIRPRLLLVEALTDEARTSLDDYVNQFGYLRARSVSCNHLYVQTERDARKLRGITIDCSLTVPILPGYGPADLATRAWSAPTTRTQIEFIAGKLRQRYRRLVWGV